MQVPAIFQPKLLSKENNPGSFANHPKEEVVEAARKGGEASHSGGFASMDAEKKHNIASKGGHALSGKFETVSERAREAGRKDGRASGGGGADDDDDDDDDDDEEADMGDRTQDNKTE